MAVKYFSEEEITVLQKNPYVKKVSSSTITYTQEFREFFIKEYEIGTFPVHIMSKAGFDPKMLGKTRIHTLSRNIRKMAQRPEGVINTRKGHSGRPVTKNLSLEEELLRLKQKVKYLEQENEFLKKIRFLDRQAQSAHNRMKNSKSSTK